MYALSSHISTIASSDGEAEKIKKCFPKVIVTDASEQMLFSKHEQVN